VAVLGLLFYNCVNRTRRPRFRTLCGIAGLKSLWAGEGAEEASERKIYEIPYCLISPLKVILWIFSYNNVNLKSNFTYSIS
jgi:hypothetical protein